MNVVTSRAGCAAVLHEVDAHQHPDRDGDRRAHQPLQDRADDGVVRAATMNAVIRPASSSTRCWT